MTITRSTRSPRLAAALLAAAALGLTACAGGTDAAPSGTASSGTASSDAATQASSPAAASAPEAGTQADALSISDSWTKAAEEGMTGSFGMLENSSDEDLHVVAVTSEAAASVELHEMALGDDGQMVMREVEDGFTVPAGGSVELAPGGNHVMFMGLTGPVEPGAEVAYELELEDGSTLPVTSVVRPFAGAEESYEGGEAEESGGHADH